MLRRTGRRRRGTAGVGPGAASAARPSWSRAALAPAKLTGRTVTVGRGKGLARSCPVCLGWLVVHWCRVCDGCRPWVRKYPQRGVCPRCRHEAHLNTDGLCKPCLMAIRVEEDAEWALGLVEARPRPVQLTLGGTYGDRSASARPLRRPTRNGRSVRVEWWTKLRQQRTAPAAPPVPEPQVHGQVPFFTMPRLLGDATVSALVGRPVAGREQDTFVWPTTNTTPSPAAGPTTAARSEPHEPSKDQRGAALGLEGYFRIVR